MTNEIPICVIGVSHKTAAVDIRETVALSASETDAIDAGLLADFDIDGCLAISTCNRTEIYVSGENSADLLQGIAEWLDDFKSCSFFTDGEHTYRFHAEEAVGQFFRVISGLDSQVIGEPQITGQVKDSYNHAHTVHSTDASLNKLVTYGLQAQKKIRSGTFLADGAVSVSYAAVELARKIFRKLDNKRVLLIGAGETAELAAMHFLERDVESIQIANRTPENARELADRFNGSAIGLDELAGALENVDIVISATSSQEHIVTREVMESVCKKRRNRPVFLIDLAVPRDIDPDIHKLDGVYLYNMDDLDSVVNSNIEKRKQEIPKALKIVDEFVELYGKWISTHSVGSTINRLKDYFENIRRKELDRLGKRLPSDGYEQIDYLTQSIVNKIMHQHIKLLKSNATDPDKQEKHLAFVNKLFDLDKE
jgi:glutamyl-tRNA reductase